jgi:hypothetical protein
MASFWLSLRQEYFIITKKAIEALLPFYTSCLCEAGFSAMITLKSKNRSELQTLVNNPTLEKVHYETLSTTGFSLVF